MGMTWKEFKEGVDKIIKEAGMDDSVEIDFIDVPHPNKWGDGSKFGDIGAVLDKEKNELRIW